MTSNRFKYDNKKGQSLIEMTIAMSLMMVGLLGIFSVLAQSIGLNRVAANQYIAANLAAEGMEVTKNIIDANAINSRPWNEGVNVNGDFGVEYDSTSLDASKATTHLRLDPSTGRYSYGSGDETGFIRTISVTNVSASEIKVVSTVSWKDRGGIDLHVDAEDHFRNWRNL